MGCKARPVLFVGFALLHADENPEACGTASIEGALRDFKTGTGGAYAPLSGGQKPFPAARVARFVRMTSTRRRWRACPWSRRCSSCVIVRRIRIPAPSKLTAHSPDACLLAQLDKKLEAALDCLALRSSSGKLHCASHQCIVDFNISPHELCSRSPTQGFNNHPLQFGD